VCCLRLANRPSAQFRNSSKQERPPSSRTTLKFWGLVLPFVQVKEGISRTSLRWVLQEQETPFNFFSYKETGKITTDELRTRTKFQRFLNKMLHSPFKQLIISTPGLLQGLHTMSLAKSVPKGLNPRECKWTKIREPPPVPYIPEKEKVQEEVANLQKLQIKTLLGCGTRMEPVRPFLCM
jgi:hypothetical protein